MVMNTVSSAGIVSWGTYLPYWRLQRAAIAQVLGSGPAKGTRAVASYDEDTTTLGVEAARRALAVAPATPQDLLFSTPAPGYLDKTSATAAHAALGLGRDCGASDFARAPRPPDPGPRVRSPYRPGRRGRGARHRRRRRRLPLRGRRRRGRAHREG